jgi:hypothetical protein
MCASRPQKPELGSLNLIVGGPQRRSNRKIERSTQWTVGEHGNRRNRQQQPANQKEKISFCQHADAEKLCEIHCTAGYNLDECKTLFRLQEDASTASDA